MPPATNREWWQLVSLLTVKVSVLRCCAGQPPERQENNTWNGGTMGEYNCNNILLWHPVIPPPRHKHKEAQGHIAARTYHMYLMTRSSFTVDSETMCDNLAWVDEMTK